MLRTNLYFIRNVLGGVSPLGRCPKGRGVPSAAEQQAPPLQRTTVTCRISYVVIIIFIHSHFDPHMIFLEPVVDLDQIRQYLRRLHQLSVPR